MADEPSLSELWRLIQDTRVDLAGRLEQLVRRDVYDAREAARDRDMQDIRKDLDALTNQRAKEAEQQRAADRRLIFTSLIAPVLLLGLVIYLASRGVHTG